MDTRPERLAEEVRARRAAVDRDLQTLQVRLQQADPRRLDAQWLAKTATPFAVAGVIASVWLVHRRRAVTSLKQLLVQELADLCAGEQQLAPALARMSAKARNAELRQALAHHREETLGHAQRLERIFRSIGVRPRRGSSSATRGVIAEAERQLKRTIEPDVRDAWLIASAQRLEHIEIASYGTARAFAETLAYTEAAQLLQQSLDEERHADETLTLLASRFVNVQSIRGSKIA